MTFQKFCALIATLLCVPGCAAIGLVKADRVDFSETVSEDAARFNTAYTDSVNAIVLQNVLRARDRLPRYYTIMSGISDAPTQERNWGGEVGGLGIGNVSGEPWATGKISGGYKFSTKPTYSVQPIADEKLTKAVYGPIDAKVFESFWNGRWPPDVTLEMMVSSIQVVKPDGPLSCSAEATEKMQFRTQQATDPAAQERDAIDQDACRHHLIAYLSYYSESVSVVPYAKTPGYECKPIGRVKLRGPQDAAYLDKEFMETLEKAKGLGYDYVAKEQSGKKNVIQKCPSAEPGVVFLKVQARAKDSAPAPKALYLKVQLRSIDSVFYDLGSQLRDGSIANPSWAKRDATLQKSADAAAAKASSGRAAVMVPAIGCRESANALKEGADPIAAYKVFVAADPRVCPRVPMFDADTRKPPRTPYAAVVKYDGATYFSGAPYQKLTGVRGASASCGLPDGLPPLYCIDHNRSMTTLSIIGQLLTLMQTPESVRPPTRFISD